METEIIANQASQDIWIKRNFNAEKQHVFKLFFEKELQIQWQGAFLKSFNFVSYECRNGGYYHSTHLGADGHTYGFKGVFHEIIENHQIIKTSEFLGLPFKVIPTLEIISFEEIDGKTHLTIQILCNNSETRDAMVQHGMKPHFDATFGLMDQLLG
jgi:uncharacterized protein YndB with AHSA1/START domain